MIPISGRHCKFFVLSNKNSKLPVLTWFSIFGIFSVLQVIIIRNQKYSYRIMQSLCITNLSKNYNYLICFIAISGLKSEGNKRPIKPKKVLKGRKIKESKVTGVEKKSKPSITDVSSKSSKCSQVSFSYKIWWKLSKIVSLRFLTGKFRKGPS